MAEPLVALTLHRPWAWAIAHSTKRVENRTWAAPASLIGRPLAIHAGKVLDRSVIDALRAGGIDCPEAESEHPLGIVAVVRVVRSINLSREDAPAGQELWALGPHGWLLDSVVALPEPVECGGRQGLWPVTDGLLERVRCQYAAAKKGSDR